MKYNVKTIEYENSFQVRLYKRPIVTDDKIISTKKNLFPEKELISKERTDEQIRHSAESSVNRTVNQIYSIARSNRWDYFITLTIDPRRLDSTDYKLILDKLSIWTNNLRKRYAPDLVYIFVPELHKDKTKWHFHGLFRNIGKIPLEFSGKVCVGKYVYDFFRKPFATKIYNLPLWKYGYSTATIIHDSDKSASYITKYITKDLSHILKNQNRYVYSHNVNTPIEKVYDIDYDSLIKIKEKYLKYVDYVSNVRLSDASQHITYMEFNGVKTYE